MHRIRLMSLLIMLGLMTGCVPLPRIYLGADEVHGTVVDAETKEPLQGVNVLEIWEQYDGYYGSYSANLILNETVTNDKGYYYFDGWWPRFTMSGHLEDFSPTLILYKYGYDSEILSNRMSGVYLYKGKFITPSYKYSEWTGKTIELKKFEGTAIDYAKATTWLDDFVIHNSRYAICDWKRVPLYTAEMIKLNKHLDANRASAYGGPYDLTLDDLRVSESLCGFNVGEVDKLLGEYLNE